VCVRVCVGLQYELCEPDVAVERELCVGSPPRLIARIEDPKDAQLLAIKKQIDDLKKQLDNPDGAE
jgi:hypothetical protein